MSGVNSRLAFGSLPRDIHAVVVIMAGGHGTRFWPLSRQTRPKQFLGLSGTGQSLIRETAERVKPLTGGRGLLVVTSLALKPLVEEHLPEAAILAEPVGRNTAPCVGFAAERVLREVGDVPMLFLPADHLVRDVEKLCEIFTAAIEIAKAKDLLVTIGIKPTQPETGYGYIEQGDLAQDLQTSLSAPKKGLSVYEVRRFVEKPSYDKALQYLNAGTYLWNSGMFVWRPSVILKAIQTHIPKLHNVLGQIRSALGTEQERELISGYFASIEPISVDFGVMEKASNVVVIPAADVGWSDVGSWSAWAECAEGRADSQGNVGDEHSIFINAKRCAISGSGRLVACVGVEDLIIVDTDDALLVCHKGETQAVKDVVDELKRSNREGKL